jgi:radical SAM protein with 4Fe4S-binding SPASM domain
MSALIQEMSDKAQRLDIPLGVQLDLTYRCDERCVHCYLDHDDRGEMTTAEIKDLLEQMADAGVFFLTLSGGEIMMRSDFFEIVEHARRLSFCVRLKTNAVMIRQPEADRIQALALDSVQISVYSHRAEVHDAITRLPGSLKRTIEAVRLLVERGVKVIFANVLMRDNFADYPGVQALAAEVGAEYTIDPTITPKIDGDRSILGLNIDRVELQQIFRDPSLLGADPEEFCALPGGPPAPQDAQKMLPCSASHTFCYVSPYGDVCPCVQFPLLVGNVRTTRFLDIWKHSPQMKEVRSITLSDLPVCSSCAHGGGSCSRCPGLAYMEGNMHGPSSQDCEKSYVRTGVITAGMIIHREERSIAGMVQIRNSTERPQSSQVLVLYLERPITHQWAAAWS